jgi:hypothetical protein
MISTSEIEWSTPLTVQIRFRPNTRDTALTHLGGLFQTVRDPNHRNSADNVPLSVDYVSKDGETATLKLRTEAGTTYFTCSKDGDWITASFVIEEDSNWFFCDGSGRSEGGDETQLSHSFSGRLALGFRGRGEGLINGDISSIAVFDRDLLQQEILDLLSATGGPEARLETRSKISVQNEPVIERGPGAGLEATTSWSVKAYAGPEDLDGLTHRTSSIDTEFDWEDEEEFYSLDELSGSSLETFATWNAEDEKIFDQSSIFFDFGPCETGFTSHPDDLSIQGSEFTVLLLGYVETQQKFLTIEKGLESEVFGVELSQNKNDSTKHDLIVETNGDFFGTRSAVWEQLLDEGEDFLLTLTVKDKDIRLTFHNDLQVRGSNAYFTGGGLNLTTNPFPTSTNPTEIQPDELTGTGSFLPQSDGILRVSGGTFSEIIVQTDIDSWEVGFLWDWIRRKYGS